MFAGFERDWFEQWKIKLLPVRAWCPRCCRQNGTGLQIRRPPASETVNRLRLSGRPLGFALARALCLPGQINAIPDGRASAAIEQLVGGECADVGIVERHCLRDSEIKLVACPLPGAQFVIDAGRYHRGHDLCNGRRHDYS